MDKPEMVKAWCLSRVGCPYIYGGTGKSCTVDYRQARAQQYPEKAEKIKRNCQRMHAGAKTCDGCRWCDPETGVGKLAYDCAQLSRGAMAAVGISLVSGANSQWNKTLWEERGGVGDLPRDKICLVFRRDGDHMGHVGVYTGDGYVIHAKGHDFGVVRQPLEDTEFTHFGIPFGLYDGKPALPILRQGDVGAYVMMLQTILFDLAPSIGVDGHFGPETAQAVKAFQKSNGLTADGVVGPKTWAALNAATAHDAEPAPLPVDPAGPDDEDDLSDIPESDTVHMSREDFAALKASYAAIAGILKKYDTVG